MTTPDMEWGEVQVGDKVICDGLYTGKTGKVLGVGSSEHSIKLLVEGTERYEPDYALLEVTVENKRAVELLLSHYSLLSSRDTHWKEREKEVLKSIIRVAKDPDAVDRIASLRLRELLDLDNLK